MSPENIQNVFQAADAVFATFSSEKDRVTFKTLVTQISNQFDLPTGEVSTVVHLYVNGRVDLMPRKGRNGGIFRIFDNVKSEELPDLAESA